MVTILDKLISGNDKYLPEILPADSCAPETIHHRPLRLNHGLIGKIFMAFDARRKVSAMDELGTHLQRDVGLHGREAFGDIASRSWNVPATWRRRAVPEWLGLEAMQLFSRPRAL
jgi:hypothetical protein